MSNQYYTIEGHCFWLAKVKKDPNPSARTVMANDEDVGTVDDTYGAVDIEETAMGIANQLEIKDWCEVYQWLLEALPWEVRSE